MTVDTILASFLLIAAGNSSEVDTELTPLLTPWKDEHNP